MTTYPFFPFFSRAFFDRTFADAFAAFFAISMRLADESFLARAGPPILPPLRPYSSNASIISVTEPHGSFFFFTPADYSIDGRHIDNLA
jgi:hypothetical protein